MFVGFLIVGLPVIAATAVLFAELRSLRTAVFREVAGTGASLRGLHAEVALANRQKPPAASLPPVVVQRKLVAVTRDDDEIHRREMVVTPPPDGDRESTDELTTVFADPARPPDSGAVPALPSGRGREVGVTPEACAWGPEDAPCGASTHGAGSLCAFHRERVDDEKRVYRHPDIGLTLHFDARGDRPVIHLLYSREAL